jgi:hypothetical protein
MNNNHVLKKIGGGFLALSTILGVGAIAPAQSQELDPNATEVLQFYVRLSGGNRSF